LEETINSIFTEKCMSLKTCSSINFQFEHLYKQHSTKETEQRQKQTKRPFPPATASLPFKDHLIALCGTERRDER
jgi:hypothetical protein